MKLDMDKIKTDLEAIMMKYCLFENSQAPIKKCVDAVKRYLSKIKAIKSYRVNCHHAHHESIGNIARLSVEITPHEGKMVKLQMELWPTPVPIDFLPALRVKDRLKAASNNL